MPSVVRIDLDEIEDALGSDVREFVKEVGTELSNQLIAEAPVSSGELRRSVQTQFVGDGQMIVYVNAPHAMPVQTGTRPHKPPIEPIRKWARRKLNDESAAWPVWQKIAEEGTEANKFATRAIDNTMRRFK